MRDFSKTKRIVVKVGTNVIGSKAGVDTRFLGVIAGQIAELVRQGRQVILVTSGAIGMGSAALGLTGRVAEVRKRQACAAVGQGILMHEYQQAFSDHGQQVGQVLLTNSIMSNRKYYVNLKNTVESLLAMQIVPIVNENDCVSIDEIDLAFGDNDRLSALVASKIDAQLLIMLTDVKGLYDRNPRRDRRAAMIPTVYEITDQIEALAGPAGSLLGTGGMASKIAAIRIASDGGCRVVLAHGREDNVILRIVSGEQIGTLFLPRRRLSNRKRWILNSRPQGRIEIDAGAAAALARRKSLLLVGIIDVAGSFQAGDVIDISDVARGVCDIGESQLRTLLKDRKKDKPPTGTRPKAIVHVNNLVLLEK